MKRRHCITLGLFLLTVTAKQEEFQGNLTEKTKGTTVTKDLLWKKENTIGHGTEAMPSENTHQHTAEVVTTKFPRAVLFDTRQTQAYKRIQIAKASSVTALPSREHFVSRNVQNSLTLTKANPSATMVGTEPRVSVKLSHEEIMSSAQFVLTSAINDTSKPQAHLSADTVKAPPWFHALHDNRNQRKTSSITLTSADGGLGVSILSASNPHVIDKLAVQHNNNDDKLAQGNSTPAQEGGVFLSSTMQSILQSDPAEDSLGGNTMTDLCLTCLDDGRAASTEKSVTLPALSPHGSPGSLGTEGLTLDLNQFPTSLHSLYHQPARELDKIQSKEITHRNTTKNLSFIERRTLIYNQTFLPFFVNKTVKHGISKNSQIKYLSDAETVMLDTRSLAEISSVTQEDIKKQSMHTIAQETSFTERLRSTTTVLYPSSKSLYNDGEPIKNGEPYMFGKMNKNASNSLSVNLTNQDISNGPLSNLTFKDGRTNTIEAHSAITPVSLRRPTITAVKTLESHILTVKADSFISVFMAKARSKQDFRTKESISTLLSNDSATKLSSVTVTRRMTDKQDSQIFNTEHNIVKQPSVDTPVEMNKPVTTEPKISTFATQKAVPVKFLPYEIRRVLGDDVSGLTLTTLSSLPFSDKPTSISSKSIQNKVFDATSDRHVTKTHQLLTEHNNLITESQNVHKLKMGDQSEEMVTEAAETETREIIKISNIQKTEEILKVHDEEQRMEDEIQDNKTEKLLTLDKTESGNLGNIINYEAGMNLNIDRKAEKMEEFLTTTSTEEHVTLRQGKDPRQGEKDTEREGVTKINSENSTQDTAERHSETLEAEGTEAESKEPLSVEDMICSKDIGKEDMTNVPLEAITNLKELSGDKGHSVSNPSSCHRLIKELEPAEQDGIHLGEKTPQIEEITSNSFSYKVTSNHSAPHSILRSPRPKVSPTTSMPKEPYSQIKLHLSTHRAVLPKHGSTPPQNKKITFSLSAVPTLSHTSHIITSKFRYILKPTVSQHSGATGSAHPFQHSISNMLSLTTPPLAITAGLLRAQPHFTVNTSLNRSIIHSITDHRHKFNTSVLRASSVLHTANEREQAEYIMPSMNTALHQQMYNDSSTKPPTVAALLSEAHISIGQLQPHQGQSATQRSQSSSCYDMTSGQPCSFKLSEQASHPDALHAHADANKQRFVQTQTSSINPKEENNQFPLSSLSPVLNRRTFGGNSLPVTYRLPGLTGSASEEKSLQASHDQENANIGSDKPLLVTAYEGTQTMQAIVTSKVKHSGTIMKAMEKKTNKKHSSPFTSTISVNIESEFTSMSVVQTENESNLTDVSNSDGKDEANTVETQSVKQPEPEISVQVVKKSQHAFPIMNEASRLHNESELGIIAGFLKPGHRAGGTHSQTVVERIERMNYSSSKDIQLARTTKNAVEHPLPKNFSGAYTQDRGEKYERHTLPEKTSISQAISGAMTDSAPPARMLPVEIINKIRYSKSGEATKTTIGAAVIDHTEEMYKTDSGITGRGPLMAENPPVIKQENGNCSSESPVSIKATPHASDPKVVPSPFSSKSQHERASVDETMSRKARNISDKTVHLERHLTPQWAELVKKTTQRRIHRETSGAHRSIATEASLSETEAATVQTRITSTEETLFSGENTKAQLDRGAGKGIFEAQNANRSIRIQAKEETAGPQSGSRLLQSEPESESELPWVNPSRRTSPHLYLSGISEVSDDLCGSGNYTAEMSLDLGSGIEPGDAVPAMGSLRVVISLKTNNSQINLGVTSCCLSPTTQPDLINSTCCLFSRLAAEPAGITLLPSALSTSASFTISLFQMINYSVVYLHCDLSICLRNHSDCERQCIQHRNRVPSEGPDIIVTNLRNRISFGPMLRQVKNSTFPQEIDASELDLVLVIVSLVIGFCLVSVMLLLVWLAYRRRAIRLLRSAAPSQACCGCVHPGGDLILP